MSATIKSYLIIGIPFTEIAEFVNKPERYEIHDRKTGKPTGKFNTENNWSIKNTTGKRPDIIIASPRLNHNKEIDISSDILSPWDIEEAYETDDTGLVIADYYDKSKVFIGKIISVIDINDVENNFIDVNVEDFLSIQEYLDKKFGYTGKVKLIHASHYSY